MKKTLILFAFTFALIALIYSCGSDTTTNTTNTTGITNLSGTVSGWSIGAKKIYARVYDSTRTNHLDIDSGAIDASGTFSLNLSAVPALYLALYKFDTTSCSGSINISSTTVKSTFLDIEVRDSLGNNLGILERKNYDSTFTAGSIYVGFNYYTAPFTANGTAICNHVFYTDTTNFNLNFVTGWNKNVTVINNINLTFPTNLSVSSTEPSVSNPPVWKYTH